MNFDNERLKSIDISSKIGFCPEERMIATRCDDWDVFAYDRNNKNLKSRKILVIMEMFYEM